MIIRGMEEKLNNFNELLSEEAVSSCSAAEICLKKLHRIPGYVKGRAAPTKQVLATENLRMELELEKNKSKALEEEVKRIKEEHGKFQQEQNQMKKQMDFMMVQMSKLSALGS
ncbi:hypothetical protein OSB04_008595 [Centaurea solstitialis]|uniref:Uncharacterized protein n=1 Tax=Centaurea solstitialis TaxID=347529 RepID=A0AA38WRI5_9ASTR|nr:hypothetical protein OSB04_008595 [Centaurea solstitialis]